MSGDAPPPGALPLFLASGEPIVRLDAEGTVLGANPAAAARWPALVTGRPLLDQMDGLPAVVAGRFGRAGPRGGALRASCVDMPGGEVWVLVHGAPDATPAEGLARFRWREGQEGLEWRHGAMPGGVASLGWSLDDPRWGGHARRALRAGLPLAFDAAGPERDGRQARILMLPEGDEVGVYGLPLSAVRDGDTSRYERDFLRQLLDFVEAPTFVVDQDERFTFVNRAFLEHVGSGEGCLADRADATVVGGLRALLAEAFQDRATGRTPRLEWPDRFGRNRTFRCEAHPIRDAADGVQQVLVVCSDITDLAGSLSEQETLLREIHHRVKNNLQMVTSMLSMQADELAPQGGREALQVAVQRVSSMALVHQLLYGSHLLSRIDFGEYARSLTRAVQEFLGPDAAVEIATEGVDIGIDSAVPLGLILNELVTNAFKHGRRADPSEEGWDVKVEVVAAGADRVRITVTDRGPGFPLGSPQPRGASIGMTLVRALVRQVRGTLTYGPGPGGEVVVACPLQPDRTG